SEAASGAAMIEGHPVISRLTGLLVSPAIIVLLLAGCSSKTSASRASPGSAPTATSVAPAQSIATPSGASDAPNDGGTLVREGPFHVECASRWPEPGSVVAPLLDTPTEGGPRACVLHGRIRAVRHAAISRGPSSVAQGEPPSALAIEIGADE